MRKLTSIIAMLMVVAFASTATADSIWGWIHMRNDPIDELLGGGAVLYPNGIARGCGTTHLDNNKTTIKFEFVSWKQDKHGITVCMIPKVLEGRWPHHYPLTCASGRGWEFRLKKRGVSRIPGGTELWLKVGTKQG